MNQAATTETRFASNDLVVLIADFKTLKAGEYTFVTYACNGQVDKGEAIFEDEVARIRRSLKEDGVVPIKLLRRP